MLKWTTRVTGLLAGVLLVASCTDSSGPTAENRLPGPQFSFSPIGITLNRQILALGQRGKLLIKGFNENNNENPHHGDAVIATFYWVGSTDIIDSVRDIQTTNPYTPVGNTYHRISFVTAGGISMATYVATNIQNFPDPNDPNTGVVYAVGAWLRDSVVDGGVRLSSWTGVEDVFAQALGTGAGAPRTAFGTGTVPTVASAGPIAVNPGGLVYGTTVVKPPVGVDNDPAYSRLEGPGADTFIKDDGLYAVLSGGGTANPNSTWFFDQAPGGGTWLAASLTLNAAAGSPPPPPPPPPNSAPAVNAGPDETALTGLLYTLRWSFSDVDHNGPWMYTINWGDGSTSTGTVSSEGSFSKGHTYVILLPRSFTVRVTVTDAAAASASDTKVVSVLLL